MNKYCKTARVRFILNTGVTCETVVNNLMYSSLTNTFTWDEHPAYPGFILLKEQSLDAIVILEIFDQQPCDE